MADSSSGPLDSLFANKSIVVLVLFGTCCGQIALLLSIICLATAKDPAAKRNAIITLIVSVLVNTIGGIAYVVWTITTINWGTPGQMLQ